MLGGYFPFLASPRSHSCYLIKPTRRGDDRSASQTQPVRFLLGTMASRKKTGAEHNDRSAHVGSDRSSGRHDGTTSDARAPPRLPRPSVTHRSISFRYSMARAHTTVPLSPFQQAIGMADTGTVAHGCNAHVRILSPTNSMIDWILCFTSMTPHQE